MNTKITIVDPQGNTLDLIQQSTKDKLYSKIVNVHLVYNGVMSMGSAVLKNNQTISVGLEGNSFLDIVLEGKVKDMTPEKIKEEYKKLVKRGGN